MKFGFSTPVTPRDVQASLDRIGEARTLPDTAAKPAPRRAPAAPRPRPDAARPSTTDEPAE